jgi:hypothetical protein
VHDQSVKNLLQEVIDAISAAGVYYKANFYSSKTPITLNDTDTTLVSLDYIGQLASLSILFDRDDVEFSLHVDGEEIYRVVLDDLKGTYDVKVSNNYLRFPISVDPNSSHLYMVLTEPAYVESNVTIKAKRTTGSTTKMESVIVVYKNKVVD